MSNPLVGIGPEADRCIRLYVQLSGDLGIIIDLSDSPELDQDTREQYAGVADDIREEYERAQRWLADRCADTALVSLLGEAARRYRFAFRDMELDDVDGACNIHIPSREFVAASSMLVELVEKIVSAIKARGTTTADQ